MRDDHWKADQKDISAELERQHIEYLHSLFLKKIKKAV